MAAIFIVQTGAATPVTEPPAQALSRCIELKSTGEDRIGVARWLLAAMASAPQTRDVASLTAGKKLAVDKGMAIIFTRLLTVDCAEQARAVVKEDVQGGFTIAGEALGRVAMAELLNNAEAKAAVAEYAKHLNMAELQKLMK